MVESPALVTKIYGPYHHIQQQFLNMKERLRALYTVSSKHTIIWKICVFFLNVKAVNLLQQQLKDLCTAVKCL